MSASVDREIAGVLREIAELPDTFAVTPDQDLKTDLGIDSLKMIDVVINVEAQLGVDLGDDFSSDLRTVADLQRYVHERVAA